MRHGPTPVASTCTSSSGNPKARWDGKKRAEHAAKVTTRETGMVARVYLCPDCHGWHVTTKE